MSDTADAIMQNWNDLISFGLELAELLMAVLTLENSSPMMVFSLEKSMMLKANLSPELGYRMPVMYNMINSQ